ncbi:sensor histidine kinase [Saccharibacillus brassicae]|uniref:Circadian input-output histidine kinase CikA n=1 Tax=Saccharibacillus brassicae TaxID=2583377 RepID=A0A4Y6UVQ3_SACBS|nr:ATP-binding protein [Saccharibacillus brassicae]QDH21799.1 sensor histidine kinase [Saccharibacillus brassicae]
MEFPKMFVQNMAVLVTFAYVANLIYKYAIFRAPGTVKYIGSVLLLIAGGWFSMFFGFKLSEDVIFDMRMVPLLIAIFVYTRPSIVFAVGLGIGLTRFSFGWSDAAVAGFVNLAILGMVGALLNVWLRRLNWDFLRGAALVIVVMNVLNSLNIAILGVIPTGYYLSHIVPYTLPTALLLCGLFALILRDFQKEQQRTLALAEANRLLKEQTEELGKNEIVLEDRAKQLQLASQYKSEFLANMSHELRTPLNSIINLAQFISESAEDTPIEETTRYGQLIYHSGEDLLKIINDILDLSKVEAGKLEIVNEDISLQEVPSWVGSYFELTAERKQLDFNIRLESSLPDTIRSDPQRLQQILRNLLANAFKFTDRGSVELRIYKAEEPQLKGEWIVFAVRDTGIGIAAEKHFTIFEAFQQADSTIGKKYGGTGLGLSISSDLSRLLGGFIRMESVEGKGSTFSLFLPLS